MRDVFKANRIYPFHVMYDTGWAEELKDVIRRKCAESERRAGGFADWTDHIIEAFLRKPGTLLWEEMKQDACDAFASDGAATDALERFLQRLRKQKRSLKLHLVGHSTGGVALGALLRTLRRRKLTFDSCALMAPACTLDWYRSNYLPALQSGSRLRVRQMDVYNLDERLELDDNVLEVYRKSLLYLVSNAFEHQKGKPLLGMAKFSRQAPQVNGLPVFHYSDGASGNVTRSASHGGFDNDPWTMNHILRRMLGGRPARPFTAEDLEY
jgi:pimeloyl-ACP methyl ester carboxylesterase